MVVVMPNRPVTVRRWEVIAIFVIVIAAAAGSVQWANHNTNERIDEAEKRISRNTEIAIQARVKAARAEDFVTNFRERIASEKVCTESNRGDPCRALFQRLSEDLSPEQRRALACAVAQELQLRPQYQEFCG